MLQQNVIRFAVILSVVAIGQLTFADDKAKAPADNDGAPDATVQEYLLTNFTTLNREFNAKFVAPNSDVIEVPITDPTIINGIHDFLRSVRGGKHDPFSGPRWCPSGTRRDSKCHVNGNYTLSAKRQINTSTGAVTTLVSVTGAKYKGHGWLQKSSSCAALAKEHGDPEGSWSFSFRKTTSGVSAGWDVRKGHNDARGRHMVHAVNDMLNKFKGYLSRTL